MSSSWCSLSTNSMQQSPFDIWSLRKWCLISISVLECMTRFIVRLIALALSHFKGMWSRITQSLQVVVLSRDFEHNNFQLQYTQLLQWIVLHKPISCNSKIQKSFLIDGMPHLCFSYLVCTLQNQNLKSWLDLKRYLWDTTCQHWLCP